MNPEELRFAKSHEWVRVENDIATVGISAFAVEALTDLVYIELPQVGRQVKAGESFSEIESVKAVSDIYAPVSGEVVAVNDKIASSLETLNSDAYGAGWLAKIKMSNPSEATNLMDYAAYQKQVQEEHH